MKECKICNGAGFYKQANHRLEIMEWVECIECMLDEHYLESIAYDIQLLLSKTSPQKLAQIVAQLLVNSMDMEGQESLQRLDSMAQGKDTMNLLVLAETTVNAIKK